MGISNWDIDASKLNRNMYLARPDLSEKDLEETANIIIQYLMKGNKSKNNILEQVQKMSKILSKAYAKFRLEQKVSEYYSLTH